MVGERVVGEMGVSGIAVAEGLLGVATRGGPSMGADSVAGSSVAVSRGEEMAAVGVGRSVEPVELKASRTHARPRQRQGSPVAQLQERRR